MQCLQWCRAGATCINMTGAVFACKCLQYLPIDQSWQLHMLGKEKHHDDIFLLHYLLGLAPVRRQSLEVICLQIHYIRQITALLEFFLLSSTHIYFLLYTSGLRLSNVMMRFKNTIRSDLIMPAIYFLILDITSIIGFVQYKFHAKIYILIDYL